MPKSTFERSFFGYMKSWILLGCIALALYILPFRGQAHNNKKASVTVSLESKVEDNAVSLLLKNEVPGIYHHFILERSIDGKIFNEVARIEDNKEATGPRNIVFKDFPFERTGLACVFYRIRAVDELGWFDFTNTISVLNKQDIANSRKPAKNIEVQNGMF